MSKESEQPACPVDHKTRAAWLKTAQNQKSPVAERSGSILDADGLSCDSSQIDQSSNYTSKGAQLSSVGRQTVSDQSLATDREISTIPRASLSANGEKPANNEQESGMSSSGKWMYPSEQMFFNAMKRKNYDPKTTDMKTIVPIHNAVNERAWMQIKQWESGWGADKCGGPRLDSFSGTATAMTPKARVNTLLGYQPPFDRHDWVVDRCGTKVDYVIDFYAGRDEGKGKGLNFYLDVRPKLNTWEGWKMRLSRWIGLV